MCLETYRQKLGLELVGVKLEDVVNPRTCVDEARGDGGGQDSSSHLGLVPDGKGKDHYIDKLRDKGISLKETFRERELIY